MYRKLTPFLAVVSSMVIFVGFRFVTQAGQQNMMQNDGYAVIGGLMILAGGILIGALTVAKHMNNKEQ